jgi:hypothetical protein
MKKFIATRSVLAEQSLVTASGAREMQIVLEYVRAET